MFKNIKFFVAALMVLCCSGWAHAQDNGWHSVADFYWEHLSNETFPELIRQHGNLSGTAAPESQTKNICGLLKYRFEVTETGWHVLEYDGFPMNWANPEVAFDDDDNDGPYLVFQGPGHKLAARIWLAKGQHTLTLKCTYWIGFPGLTRWRVRPALPQNFLEHVSVVLDQRTSVYAEDEPIAFTVRCGGSPNESGRTLYAELVESESGRVVARKDIQCPGAGEPQVFQIGLLPRPIPGKQTAQGSYKARFVPLMGASEGISFDNIWVVPRSPAQLPLQDALPMELVEEIDCAQTPPDYMSQASPATSVSIAGLGEFLQTGPRGWYRNKDGKRDMSFFAYDVDGLKPGQPYVIQFDYPDDAYRLFTVVAFDKAAQTLSSGGADSGWDFPLSNSVQTGEFLHFARSSTIQVAVLNMYGDAKPAAIKAIRVYALPEGLGALPRPESGGRRFASWFEEGSTFIKVYGTGEGTAVQRYQSAIRNWMTAAVHQGVTTLVPTVAVYDALYPSQYHESGSSHRHHDTVKHILLEAERYGLEVIPEFHPKAGQLKWTGVRPPAQRENILYGKSGKPSDGVFGPVFNPLHSNSRRWALGMVREFLQRYKDHPNMPGICLRFMGWADPALWSFGGSVYRQVNQAHGMFEDSFGYGDQTIKQFIADTGLNVDAGVPANASWRFKHRHDFLMGDAGHRRTWEEWKGDKVAEVVTQIRQVMDAEAPHLKLYLHIAGIGPNSHGRTAGFDAAKLGNIPGVVLINGVHNYGRKGLYNMQLQQYSRETLVDPGWLHVTSVQGKPSRFIEGHNYMECAPAWLPYKELGWPDCNGQSNCFRPMLSGVVNPSGRNALERYAVHLADGDALMLGDGGNSIVWWQKPAREFLRRYLALPEEPFQTVPDGRGNERTDPVAVRQLKKAGKTIFYVVNREPYPLRVSLRFAPGADGVVYDHLDTTKTFRLAAGALQLELDAYELKTFFVTGLEVQSVQARVPTEQLRELEKQIAWHEQLLQGKCNGAACGDHGVFGPVWRRLQQAKAARKAGNIWAARTAFEFVDINTSLDLMNVRSPYLRKLETLSPSEDQ